MQYVSFTNPAYVSADDSLVNVELVLTEGATAVPYTAGKNDAISAGLYAAIIAAGGIAPYAAPALTLAEQATAMLSAGVTISSTATPALNGTYAVGPNERSNLTSMYDLIQRAGGSAFPAGLSALPWPDSSGAVHIFAKVSDFLNFETAIGGWVLELQLVITTGAGTLPSSTVTIP